MRAMLRRRAVAWIAASIIGGCAMAAAGASPDTPAERISISNGKFVVGGRQIWMNGANTPWHHWNDLGGDFDPSWWDAHFSLLHDRGINATRVWISCSGDVGIEIDENGHVSGATPAYWSDLGRLLDIAQKHKVYVLATLMSFDHFKSDNHNFRRWRRWIGTDDGIDSYIRNFIHPLLERYGHSPRLWAIDLMNEPEWVFENAEEGNIPWERLQGYFARAASEIHRGSEVLVTIGMAMPKYNSDVARSAKGNRVGDPSLRAAFNDPGARLDFYSTHYYDWCEKPMGQCVVSLPSGIRAADLQTRHHRGVPRARNQGSHRHGRLRERVPKRLGGCDGLDFQLGGRQRRDFPAWRGDACVQTTACRFCISRGGQVTPDRK